MKKLLCLILGFVLLFCINGVTEANAVTVSSECDISDVSVPITVASENAAIGATLDISAKSAILLEVNTGKVLYESNADEILPPASITKIMSLVLIMEAIDKGVFDLETVVTASEHAASMGGSQIWLEENEAMTVDDLLKATVIASANDATVALAEAVAGSEEGFVALMNSKAKSLGMNNTIFKNATGLDAEGHLTTARDVAVMSAELVKHELIKNYSTVWMDTLRDGESELVNTNKLVRFYSGCTGLKTGTTSGAGYCLSATAERNGLNLVAVIMGGDSSSARFEGAKKLLDYGFANYKFSKIGANIDPDLSVKIGKGTEPAVGLDAKKCLNLLTESSNTEAITRKTVINKGIEAPIKKGQVLGRVDIYNGKEKVGSIPLTAKSNVKRLNYPYAVGKILMGIFKL